MSEPVAPLRILGDAARLAASALGEVVPAQAQRHLLNAQRELFMAVTAVVEHNSGRTPRRPRGRPADEESRRRPRRVELD